MLSIRQAKMQGAARGGGMRHEVIGKETWLYCPTVSGTATLE